MQPSDGLDANFTARAPKPQVLSPSAQAMLVEVKVLDAVLASALAPYNRNLGTSPFSNNTMMAARNVQILLYYTAGKMVAKNSAAQTYIARATARAWKSPGIWYEASSRRSHSSSEEIGVVQGEHERTLERWIDLLVYQSKDPLGSTSLLTVLLKGNTKAFSTSASSERFLNLVKDLIKSIGPQPRLLSMVSALCTSEGLSTRTHQEACVRKLWMDPIDRYAFGVSFHEFRQDETQNGDNSRQRYSDLPKELESKLGGRNTRFVGDEDPNTYAQVVVSWCALGSTDISSKWQPNENALWYAPADLGLPVFGFHNPSLECTSPENDSWPIHKSAAQDLSEEARAKRKSAMDCTPPKDLGSLPLVPIEWLLWPLEPEKLCLEVTHKKLPNELQNEFATPFKSRNSFLERKKQGSRDRRNHTGTHNMEEALIEKEVQRSRA